MGKKFSQLLEGKHRNHTRQQMGDSTAYVVIHDICINKLLTADEKVKLIDGFCQNALTVQDVSTHFKNDSLD